jgi:hypothetical protein
MGELGNAYKILVRKILKGRNNFEVVDGRIVLKQIK